MLPLLNGLAHFERLDARFGAGSANLRRAYAGGGKEASKPLRLAGDKGKRLNRKPFCRFFR